MNLFTGRQARPQASTNSLKWLWLACQVFLAYSILSFLTFLYSLRSFIPLLVSLGFMSLGVAQATELPMVSTGRAITTEGQFVDTTASFRGGVTTSLDGSSYQTMLEAPQLWSEGGSSPVRAYVQAQITVDAADVGKSADLLFVIGSEPDAPFDGGTDTTYTTEGMMSDASGKVFFHDALDLYNAPYVWMKQLEKTSFVSDVTLESEMSQGIWLNLNSSGRYYIFVGYRPRSSSDGSAVGLPDGTSYSGGNVVFAATPLIVQVYSLIFAPDLARECIPSDDTYNPQNKISNSLSSSCLVAACNTGPVTMGSCANDSSDWSYDGNKIRWSKFSSDSDCLMIQGDIDGAGLYAPVVTGDCNSPTTNWSLDNNKYRNETGYCLFLLGCVVKCRY